MTREEAIKVVKERLDYYESEKRLKAACEVLIPELKESEDERIRKGLIEALKTSKTVGELKFILPEPTREECIAYLEKQKDASKAIEAVDRIDKYIDENVANAHDMKDSNPDKKYYRGWDDALGAMAGILQDVYSEKENKFAPRVLPCSAAWFEDGDEKQKEQKPSEWSEEEKDKLNSIERLIVNANAHGNYLIGDKEAIKLQHFLESLCPQSKQEWSKEDEEHKQWILECLADGKRKVPEFAEQYQAAFNWLKFLRPSWKPSEQEKGALKTAISVLTEERSFPKDAAHLQAILDAFDGKEAREEWKPSEEQMTALRLSFEEAFDDAGDCNRYRDLKSLYEHLKKLM